MNCVLEGDSFLFIHKWLKNISVQINIHQILAYV